MQALKSLDDMFPVSEQEMAQTIAAPMNARLGGSVSALIDLHRDGALFEIEVSDKPADALIALHEKLQKYGMSYAVAESMIEPIGEAIVHEAGDFTRKKKPTPLTIRAYVTDRMPDIDTENKTIKIIVFDGVTKFSGAGGGVGMANTINGTTTTEFDTPDFEEIFTAGRKYVLVIELEKDATSKLNGIDANVLGAALVEAVGPGVSVEAMEEINQSIEAGEIAPELAGLIETLAELKALEAQAAEPNAPAELSAKIEVLQTRLAQQVSVTQDLPPVLAQTVMDSFDGTGMNVLTLGSANNVRLSAVQPDNDNHVPGVTSPEAAMEMAADVALDLSMAEKASMLEILESADIPANLREKMVDAVASNEFTVDDFKVVEARIESPETNPAVAEMAQKVEATAKEFAADVERAIPPVSLPQPLSNLIVNTIQDLPDMPTVKKAELVQVLKQGPLPSTAAMQVVQAIVPVKPVLANAIERHQISQAVTLQAMKLAANIPPSAQTNRSVAAVTQVLSAGNVPNRIDSDIAKAALPQPQKKALEVLNALQEKRISVIAVNRDVKAEMKGILDVIKNDEKAYPPTVRKVVEKFIDAHPNPTPADIKKWIEKMPEGDLRNNILSAVEKYNASQPKNLVIKGDDVSLNKVAHLMERALEQSPLEHRRLIESVRDKLLSGDPVSHKEFQEFYKRAPETVQAELSAAGGPIEYAGQETVVAMKCKGCKKGNCAECQSSFAGATGDVSNLRLGGNKNEADKDRARSIKSSMPSISAP